MNAPPEYEPSLDFAEVITDLDHGRVNAELGRKLAKIVEAVEKTGKEGKLTLQIKVKKEGEMCMVHVEATSKRPEHPMMPSLFFFGEDGRITREDPRQLTLREIQSPKLRTLRDE